jgi:SAM-dependent methyltransferase
MKTSTKLSQAIETDTLLTGHDDYYRYMQTNPVRRVLFHMFADIYVYKNVYKEMQKVLQRPDNLRIMIMGSATPENLLTVHHILRSYRPNRYLYDEIWLIDINPYVIKQSESFLQKYKELKSIHLIHMDMNKIPSEYFNLFDIVINDFTLPFNTKKAQNSQTVQSIKNVLKKDGIALVSSHVLEEEEVLGNDTFVASERLERKAWSKSYFENLFRDFETTTFAQSEGDAWEFETGLRYRRYLLRKKNLGKSSPEKYLICCANIAIEKKTYEIISNNTPTNAYLSESQFAVLSYLLSKSSRVVTREEIASVIWKENANIQYSDWAISKIISRLRKILKKYNSSLKITTLKSRGYTVR